MNARDLKPEDFPPGELCLLEKRGLYWRPNSCGYTSSLYEAGLYEREDALRKGFRGGEINGGIHGEPTTLAIPLRWELRRLRLTHAQVSERMQHIRALMEALGDK